MNDSIRKVATKFLQALMEEDEAFEAWESNEGLVLPVISRPLLLRLRRRIRPLTAMEWFDLYERLYYVMKGAPPPEDGFFQGFRRALRLLERSLPHLLGDEISDTVISDLTNGFNLASFALRRIDRGDRNPRIFQTAASSLLGGMSSLLTELDTPIVTKSMPGGGHFPSLKTQTEETKEVVLVPKEIREVFTLQEHSLPKKARQQSADLGTLFSNAKEAMEQQLDLLNRGTGLDSLLGASVARGDLRQKADLSVPGPVIQIGPLKRQARVLQKLEESGEGPDSVLDLVRATVAVDTLEEIPLVMENLRRLGVVIVRDPKNRFNNPTESGYRDLMFNVRYPNGHIGEIQVNLKTMLEAKSIGHKYYEVVRTIEARKKFEGNRTLTAQEQRLVDEANALQLKLYNEAWRQAAMNSGGSVKLGSSKVAESDDLGVAYFEYNDRPAMIKRRHFPVVFTSNGREVVIYDVKAFRDSATPVTRSVWLSMMKTYPGFRRGKSEMITPEDMPRNLPEDPWKYFNAVPGSILVPIKKLNPIRARPQGIHNAKIHMWEAFKGGGKRRDPISLKDNGDGTYTVLDGNSTYAVAKECGWDSIPATVER
jgi:hypothetical protein